MSLDPKPTVGISPYAAFNNSPIYYNDPKGDTTLPSADGGQISMADGVSNIKTFDQSKNYTVGGKNIKPASGAVMSFDYNKVSYTAMYNTKDLSFAYYLGIDGSKLGYDMNSISSNITFTGGERLATAAMILAVPARTPGVNKIPPAYIVAGAVATAATLSAMYHWNDVSNDFSMTRPLPFSYPLPSLPVAVPFTGHGNRMINSNPQMVYEFSFTPRDTRTPILKYGISDMYKTGYSRPEMQEPVLKAIYGNSVKWKPLLFTPNRASALAAEKAMVTAHYGIYNEMPRVQILPKP